MAEADGRGAALVERWGMVEGGELHLLGLSWAGQSQVLWQNPPRGQVEDHVCSPTPASPRGRWWSPCRPLSASSVPF